MISICSCRAVKQTRLKDLRAKSYQGSDEEWSKILAFVLGQSSSTDDGAGLEVSAHIAGSDQDDKELVITIRKRVQTITVGTSQWRLSLLGLKLTLNSNGLGL
jgi:hypothetical protein